MTIEVPVRITPQMIETCLIWAPNDEVPVDPIDRACQYIPLLRNIEERFGVRPIRMQFGKRILDPIWAVYAFDDPRTATLFKLTQ